MTARAEADAAVLAPVRGLIAALLAIMQQGRTVPFAERAAALAPVIDRTFDLATILRESTGAAWATLAPEQQGALRDAFRGYTIASYVHSFDSLSGQRFEVLPDTRIVGNGTQIVQTRLIAADGEVHALDYVMRQNGGWLVVDVLADGSVSRVAVQRSDFRRLLTQGGAAVMVASLRQKTAELSGG
jgi:phospholipid transport system substrate-binding protein